MSAPIDSVRARNLRTLAALAGLFLLPLALAFYTYYATGWRPAGHTNHGTLITPARPLPAATALFHRKWSLVYVGSGDCDSACRDTLYVMRQTRLSLNTDMTRVEQVLLVTGQCCNREFLAREHPGLAVVDASGLQGERLLRQFPAADREHTLFIVDPLGNLMMSYDARIDPSGLRDDLKKLLRLSQIG